MVSTKRIIAAGLAFCMLWGALPVAVQGVAPSATINLVSATSAFNPTIGQRAEITYNVSGTAPATGVTIEIREAVATTGRLCNDLASTLVGTIEGPVTRPAGTYTAYWSGTNPSGEVRPAGLYCYQIYWSNAPISVTNPLIEGLITLTASSTSGSSSSGSASSGSGTGSGSSGTAQHADVEHYVEPNVVNIDRVTRAPDSDFYIHYATYRRIDTGLTLVVRDNSNNTVRLLTSTNAPVGIGNYTQVWNVRYVNGDVVPVGTYKYVFLSNGAEIPGGTGFITVQYASSGGSGGGTNPPPATPAPVLNDQGPSPQNFVPCGTTGAQSGTCGTTFAYTVNQNSQVNVEIFQGSVSVVKLPSNGSYYNASASEMNKVYWNGKTSAGVPVQVDSTYTYKITAYNSNGQAQPVTGAVYATAPAAVSAFIDGTPTVSPSSFTPELNQTATLNYKVGKNVSNFVLSVRNESGATVASVSTAYKTAGVYSWTWNGTYDADGVVPAGIYRFVFEAAYETPVYGPTVRVDAAPRTAPVIMDLGPTPSSFIQGSNTSFRYQLTQDSRVDITVFSGNTTVRRVLVSGTSNNGSAAGATNYINMVVWDGKDEANLLVSPGTYVYVIEARNSNGVAQSKTGTVTIMRFEPPANAMDVSNVYANPSTFNPFERNALLTFTLNRPGNVTVRLTGSSGGSYVVDKTLVNNEYRNEGANQSVSWNGMDQNNIVVQDGTYTFTVTATSTQYGTDSAVGTVVVSRGSTPPSNLMDIYNLTVDPATFNPFTQSTIVRFTLNYSANVYVRVNGWNSGTYFEKTIVNQYMNSGANTASWNGTDQNNVVVADGNYTITVSATSTQYGTDSVTATVTTSRGTVAPADIYNVTATPNPFNPYNGEVTRITFNTSTTPSSVSVAVYRLSNNSFIKTLTPVNTGSPYAGYAYRADWDGRDSNGNIVQADSYTYRINIVGANGYNAQNSGTVVVSTSTGGTVGNCGSFSDVKTNNYLCPAIEFVTARGIFVGYPNGTLGLDRVIQRAELAAVMQKAFRFPLDSYYAGTDGSLGYKDLENSTGEWYMPYIKTFSRLNLMVGYPDGRMRPERTMNTAELYLVFLKSALKSPLDVANFTLPDRVTEAPFVDTPVNSDTRWYLKYVMFAKLNDLVTTERFYPARGITRGQVIQLIYDTYRKGLITYAVGL